jgi:phenylacetate-CoA ligase
LLSRLRWTAYVAWQLPFQARFPFRSPEAIERVQAVRVQNIVEHAYRTVPYYRETLDRLGLRPGDFRVARDLERLPILERGQLQRDPEYFLSAAHAADPRTELASGGTTGQRCTVYYDSATLFHNTAMAAREESMHGGILGRRLGYRKLRLAKPRSSGAAIRAHTHQRGLIPSRLPFERDTFSMYEPPSEIIRYTNRTRPDVLGGFGSVLDNLFSYASRSGKLVHRPKLVTFGSDALSARGRQIIAEEFGIPVFGSYSAVEMLTVGFECDQHRGYHLNVDTCALRVVGPAGESLPAGQSGDVIVSNLMNRATVLLNYRLGDVATLGAEPCPCGRSLPLLASVDGRRDEWFERPSGYAVHTQQVRELLRGERTIARWQAVQEADGLVKMALVLDADPDPTATRERMRRKLRELMGEDAPIEVVVVDAIPPGPSGKHRPILSRRHSLVPGPPT